jgi:outer membrane lipopolysaccharide assembly protein LptE/RlpB
MIRRVVPALLGALLVASALGCGYHLTGKGSNLPASIKSIGVPAFTNSTSRPELGQRVTEKVTQELVRRGRYRVTQDATGVDAVLSGVVESWNARPVQLGAQRSEAQRVAVTLRASVRFEDKATGRVIYENDAYAFTQEYETIGDPEAYFDTELGAVDEVAEDFARAVVSAIMTGF